MPPEENTIQNPSPDPTSLPTSPQPSTPPSPEAMEGQSEPATEITPISEAPVMPPEAPETPREAVISESHKEAPPTDHEIRVESGNEPIPLEPAGTQATPASNGTSEPLESPTAPAEAEAVSGRQSAPVPVEPTAQMGRNEPLNPVLSILKKAQEMIQARKRKKLEKILTLFNTKSKITNDEVEKYLHCSDATATRYLSILEKEGKIQQIGKTGQGVSYIKI